MCMCVCVPGSAGLRTQALVLQERQWCGTNKTTKHTFCSKSAAERTLTDGESENDALFFIIQMGKGEIRNCFHLP